MKSDFNGIRTHSRLVRKQKLNPSKMVLMWRVMLRFVLKLLLIFFIKRQFFVTSNSVCYSFQDEDINDNAATFIYELLYVVQN